MANYLSITELQKNYQKVLRTMQRTQERIIITRYGKPAAALIPIEDYEVIQKVKKSTRKS